MYCRSCPECQNTVPGRGHRVPLIPLPITDEPFQRIVMGVVGLLPRVEQVTATAYQARLQRVGHFLVHSEGAWWHKASADGSTCFHDGHDDPQFFHAGPELLHFRNSDMEDVSRCSKASWQEALEKQISLPVIDVIRCYDCDGEVSRIFSPEEHGAVADPEVYLEGSFMLPTIPPLSSTSLKL